MKKKCLSERITTWDIQFSTVLNWISHAGVTIIIEACEVCCFQVGDIRVTFQYAGLSGSEDAKLGPPDRVL